MTKQEFNKSCSELRHLMREGSTIIGGSAPHGKFRVEGYRRCSYIINTADNRIIAKINAYGCPSVMYRPASFYRHILSTHGWAGATSRHATATPRQLNRHRSELGLLPVR